MANKKPLFGTEREFGYMQSLTLEASGLFFREIEIRVIDRDATVHDPMYGDSKDYKFKSFWTRAQIDIQPKKSILTKFGLSENRHMIAFIPRSVFEYGDGPNERDKVAKEYSQNIGGYPIPREGDVLVIEDESYRVIDQQKIDYWGHLEESATYLFACDRMPDRSVADEIKQDSSNPAGPTVHSTYETDYFAGEPE